MSPSADESLEARIAKNASELARIEAGWQALDRDQEQLVERAKARGVDLSKPFDRSVLAELPASLREDIEELEMRLERLRRQGQQDAKASPTPPAGMRV